jgi:heat shock protein HtpX
MLSASTPPAANRAAARMPPTLDASRRHAHKRRNVLQSALLVGGIGLLTVVCAWLIWGDAGVLLAALAIGLLYAFAPRVPPDLVMRMYRAQQVDPARGGQIAYIVETLARRAGLATVPALYVIPSTTLNAFATGTPDKAAVGITHGLLQRLNAREIAGVLAHELSHVRNNDLAVMGLADVMTRFTQILSYLALILAVLNLPAMLLGDSDIPFSALVLLYLAPTISSLLQLGLSRTREFDADLEGATLTGDPAGLASALDKLERYQGRFWEDLMFPVPGRRIPQPSLLRSHPPTADRIARLLALENRALPPPIETSDDEPSPAVAAFAGRSLEPRYRFPGVWF